MKRISWDLPVFSLPDFNFYDADNKIKQGQTPITPVNGELPIDNSYFIGTIGTTDGNKLLCYHISDGKYIVVSYNRNTEIIFKDIIDIYDRREDNKGININTGSDLNPTVSIINPDGTVINGTVGEDNE